MLLSISFPGKVSEQNIKNKINVGGYITLGVTFLLGRIANNLILIGIGSLLSHEYELAVSMMFFQFMNSMGVLLALYY